MLIACGSDATEHATYVPRPAIDADILQLYVEEDNTVGQQRLHVASAFGVTTHDILIGPCRVNWSIAMHVQLGTIRRLQKEIQRRARVPVKLDQLLQHHERYTTTPVAQQQTYLDLRQKNWSSITESISRCTAAFQKAADATEHSECQNILNKICDYTIALALKTPAYCGQADFITIVYKYIVNRTHNLAFIAILDQALVSQDSTRMLGGQQREECLLIVDRCLMIIQGNADQLHQAMQVYNSCHRP